MSAYDDFAERVITGWYRSFSLSLENQSEKLKVAKIDSVNRHEATFFLNLSGKKMINCPIIIPQFWIGILHFLVIS